MTEHIKCIMKVSYYELYNEVTDVEESDMRSEIWQYINYSW